MLLFIGFVFLIFVSENNFINATFLKIESYHAYEYSNDIFLYKENILIKVIVNSTFLDMNDEYLLFNQDN